MQYCINHYQSVKLELLLALFCGLRVGEIRGLRFDDCDESNHTIHISRADCILDRIVFYRGVGIRTQKREEKKAPKTESSDRTIRVHPIIFTY